MKTIPMAGLIISAMLTSASGADGKGIGLTGGTLAPCPDSPNCVSTRDGNKKHAMTPLPFLQTPEASREKILSILKGMKRVKIVTATDSYIHAECSTALFGFVDDVEFYLDETARVVHFRSASRLGYYDFGVNRSRMKKISKHYLRAGER